MGVTPIPIAPRPPLSDEEMFRREITPPMSHGDEVLNLAIVGLFILLLVIPFVWWAAA